MQYGIYQNSVTFSIANMPTRFLCDIKRYMYTIGVIAVMKDLPS